MDNTKYWVTMTDKFLSGWGMAEGKTNKLVLACDNVKDAEIVMENARARTEMKYINLCINEPRYDARKVLVSNHDKSDYESWYQKGYFKNGK